MTDAPPLAAFIAAALVVSTTGCGTGGEPPLRSPASATQVAESPRVVDPPDDPRLLSSDATFADLVQVARALDDRRDTESSAGCLLGDQDNAWRLAADLSVAVRPAPAPAPDLDARFEANGAAVTVFTRWGAIGSGAEDHPSVVALTSTLPLNESPATVWIVTERGVYVRRTDQEATGLEAGPATPDSVRGALFIAAEAGISVARLAQVLSAASRERAGYVALAVVLQEGTRLPAPPSEEADEDPDLHLCPTGLSPLTEESPSGSVRPDLIVQSLAPLRQGAAICVGTTGGSGAGGGRVVLAIRIGLDGRVEESCVTDDETGDPGLRGCLLRAVAATHFPMPEPAGRVDVHVPLVLQPEAWQRQLPLCP